MSVRGKQIKKKLLDIDKSQRWLLAELHKNGFGTLYETRLSGILSGSCPGGCAESVLKTPEIIIKEVGNSAKRKRSVSR